MYYPFYTLIKCHCQLFISRVKIVDQCDKPVNLGNFAFDGLEIVWNSLDVHLIDLF